MLPPARSPLSTRPVTSRASALPLAATQRGRFAIVPGAAGRDAPAPGNIPPTSPADRAGGISQPRGGMAVDTAEYTAPAMIDHDHGPRRRSGRVSNRHSGMARPAPSPRDFSSPRVPPPQILRRPGGLRKFTTLRDQGCLQGRHRPGAGHLEIGGDFWPDCGLGWRRSSRRRGAIVDAFAGAAGSLAAPVPGSATSASIAMAQAMRATVEAVYACRSRLTPDPTCS